MPKSEKFEVYPGDKVTLTFEGNAWHVAYVGRRGGHWFRRADSIDTAVAVFKSSFEVKQ
jgi:hypothetical protein